MTMPNIVKQRHPGYSGGQAMTSVNYSLRDGDAEVVDLFNQYTGPESKSSGWEFRKRAIKCAYRLFNGQENWFLRQDQNGMVQDYNYEFLQDTIRFIATGKRRMNLFVWQDLIIHQPEHALKGVEHRHEIADQFKSLALSTSFDAMFQRWISHPGGFDDLMMSLHLMFGRMNMRYDYV